jgi:hypothetical protein
MRVINGNRQKAEVELLKAIWTDSTPRYKTLMRRLYPAKPSLILVKKSIGESVTTTSNSDNLKQPL